MAETLMIGGNEYKKRSPLGVWALALVTLGIYFFVWYYKVNREAREYLRDNEISPGIALLAVTLGWLIIVPPFVSTYRTGQRIERMQEQAQVIDRVSPGIGLLLFIFSRLDMIYYQEHLNRIWRRYQQVPEIPSPESPQPLPEDGFTT
jgi:hypothetical protein